TDVTGSIDGEPLGIPQFEPYPQPGTSSYLLFLFDVTGATRELQEAKLTFTEIASQAQAHHLIDAATYGDRLENLVPSEADGGAILDLVTAVQPCGGNANLGQALLTAINVPSSTPVERRAIFVFTDGHIDDTLNTDSLLENAKRTMTELNFI